MLELKMTMVTTGRNSIDLKLCDLAIVRNGLKIVYCTTRPGNKLLMQHLETSTENLKSKVRLVDDGTFCEGPDTMMSAIKFTRLSQRSHTSDTRFLITDHLYDWQEDKICFGPFGDHSTPIVTGYCDECNQVHNISSALFLPTGRIDKRTKHGFWTL